MSTACPVAQPRRFRGGRFIRKAVKRILPLILAIYFVPGILAFYLCCGLLDVLRNQRRTLATLDRYFAGNGLLTWGLSPFNLLMDLLSLPFRNRGIYKLTDLPQVHQDEIAAVIEAAHRRDVIGQLEGQGGRYDRGMLFFKWYGKNTATSIDVPEFHQDFEYIRTIGLSIFNKRQSTSKHYGPLRITLRVLYNINHIDSKDVYIRVGNHTHPWKDSKLFIFDDTLQHKSCNGSDEVRYCLFVDILRPTLVPKVTSAVLSCVRWLFAPINSTFYRQWKFIK